MDVGLSIGFGLLAGLGLWAYWRRRLRRERVRRIQAAVEQAAKEAGFPRPFGMNRDA